MFISSIEKYVEKTAIYDEHGIYSYHQLVESSNGVAAMLLNKQPDLKGQRILFMVKPGFLYAVTLIGIWKAGAVAVPIHTQAPDASVQYMLEDTSAAMLLSDLHFEGQLAPLAAAANVHFIKVTANAEIPNRKLPAVSAEDDALIIYTSGTTGKPKGVLTTHQILEAQMQMLIQAWEWSSEDAILNVLPLHHVHGLVNALLCPLRIGASVHFLSKFDAALVWDVFTSGKVNVFMAVPTIYVKLIADYESATKEEKKRRATAVNAFRLMVSGSAALPLQVLEAWKNISGHTLLERYGMTEIGMALSNPYKGERKAGFVGLPLPKVEVRLVEDGTNQIIEGEEQPGEIQIKGPAVFKCYWGRAEATSETFSADGWFRTGDVAIRQDGYYKILGRLSTDIIKSGGYKLSALEIEEALRENADIQDCAVVALPDEEWGEKVAVAIIPKIHPIPDAWDKTLATWLRSRLAPYKIPRNWIFVEELPRNAMGKVNKKELKHWFNS